MFPYLGCAVVFAAVCLQWTSGGFATELSERLDRQEARIAELEAQLRDHDQVLRRLPTTDGAATNYGLAALHNDHVTEAWHGSGACDCPSHYVGYEKGFFIRPYCPDAEPFELKVNGRIQFRHTAFDRQANSYFDRAMGVAVPVEERNDFEIERGRITFSGFVHDPKLQYFINLDLDTDDNHRAIAHDFWFNYKFNDLVNLYAGKAFVPGSREWLDGALRMRLGDRSLATTFFRPDRSIGLWSIGKLTDKLKYRAMIGNGFSTTDLAPAEIDDRFMVSGTTWWEPLAAFGVGYSDLQWHEELALRFGTSATYASQEATETGTPRPEENFVRLSDGVRLVDTGALAPGVTVNSFDVLLLAADIAGKYQGFSFSGEFYARWIDDLVADGAIPFSELYDDGFYFECGYMVCREKFEVAGRLSSVDGIFGDAWEYTGGVNWFMNGHNNKITFDVSYLDGSPANNSGTNFRRGDRGVMFRTAWQVAF